MELYEKYLCGEINPVSSIFFRFKLKVKRKFREEFEHYKITSENLKNMFLINAAEKEIRNDKRLEAINTIIEKYLMQNKKDNDILDYLDYAFSK